MNESKSIKHWSKMFGDLGYDVDPTKKTVTRNPEKVDLLRRDETRREIINEKISDAIL